MREHLRKGLNSTMKRALLTIYRDQSVARETGFWRGRSGAGIYFSTISGLFDRLLVKIVVESRHRRRHTAVLTEIGLRVARDIDRELACLPPRSEGEPALSEESALFIAAVVG